jgi:rare lipoprotein A (peptidoglycan hydrolase)
MTRIKMAFSILAGILPVIWLLGLAGCMGHPSTGPSDTGPEKEVFVGLASFADLKDMPVEGGQSVLYTAAHRTLPFGTHVMVTNLQNNHSVIVTITHRGPEQADQIMQVNLAAGRELNMPSGSAVQVRLEVVHE